LPTFNCWMLNVECWISVHFIPTLQTVGGCDFLFFFRKGHNGCHLCSKIALVYNLYYRYRKRFYKAKWLFPHLNMFNASKGLHLLSLSIISFGRIAGPYWYVFSERNTDYVVTSWKAISVVIKCVLLWVTVRNWLSPQCRPSDAIGEVSCKPMSL
jgi:hypothetical protein